MKEENRTREGINAKDEACTCGSGTDLLSIHSEVEGFDGIKDEKPISFIALQVIQRKFSEPGSTNGESGSSNERHLTRLMRVEIVDTSERQIRIERVEMTRDITRRTLYLDLGANRLTCRFGYKANSKLQDSRSSSFSSLHAPHRQLQLPAPPASRHRNAWDQRHLRPDQQRSREGRSEDHSRSQISSCLNRPGDQILGD